MNYLAVIVVGLASTVLGALWYSEILFGKMWMRAMGWTVHEMDRRKKETNMVTSMILMTIASIVTIAVLALLIERLGAVTATAGALIGLLVWIGFVATTNLSPVVWEGKSAKAYWIFILYQAVSLAVSGAVLAIWS